MPNPPLKNDDDFSQGSEDRVQLIVARARRQIAIRDLLVFGAGRAWLAAVAVGGALLTLLFRPKTRK